MAQQDRQQGVASAARVFYQLVTSDAPSVDEFKSYHALGKEPPKSKRNDPRG